MLYPNPGPSRLPAADTAAVVEGVAAALFALLAGVATDSATIAAAFAAAMFFAAFASGAHINPGVSVASALSGHTPWTRALIYVIAQLVGTLAGTSLLLMIVPGLHFGDAKAAACHGPAHGMGGTSLFLWEALLAFIFVFVLYGAIMHPPGHGALAPISAGVTLFACLAAGGQFTGMSPLNPAITLASTLLFDCYWRYSWMYLLAQVTGAGLAAGLAAFIYGKGPFLMDEEQRRHYFATMRGGGGGGSSYEPLLGEERVPAPQGTAVGGGAML